MKEYPTHIFAGDPLDRVDAARRDPMWIEARLNDPSSRFLPFWSMKVLATNGSEPALAWRGREMLAHLTDDAPPVLLGLHEQIAHFALDVSGPADPTGKFNLEDDVDFVEPRRIATTLPLWESGTLAHAKSAVDWHARHGFCANCGARTHANLGGKERICDGCGAHHFPRTDPVAIMLVHRGERCLLGRSSRRGTGSYSALAGFIDQGESIEEAVRREIMEEANIRSWGSPLSFVPTMALPFLIDDRLYRGGAKHRDPDRRRRARRCTLVRPRGGAGDTGESGSMRLSAAPRPNRDRPPPAQGLGQPRLLRRTGGYRAGGGIGAVLVAFFVPRQWRVKNADYMDVGKGIDVVAVFWTHQIK